MYLGYFDFFPKSVYKLEFKKSLIHVHIIPNFESIKSFKTNLGCILVILIFSSKLVFQQEFKKSPIQFHVICISILE